MKKIIFISISILLYVSLVAVRSFGQEAEEKILSICPKTLMSESCLQCHQIPNFSLKPVKEKPPFREWDPPYGIKVLFGSQKPYLYYKLITINDSMIFELFEYANIHFDDISKVVIEIHSPGGSMFNAYRIVGMIESFKKRGGIVETRVNGFALSAGFLIALSGSDGFRLCSKTAEYMWHELLTFSMFDVSGPSDKEDEAKVLRHLQTNANTYIQNHSRLTVQQIEELTRKKEFWMNGREAVEIYGIADGYL